MRQIGSLGNVEQADLLADFLLSQGIKCHLDQTDSGYVLWALDDDLVAVAKDHYRQFVADPSATIFQQGAVKAKAIRKNELDKRRQYRKNVIDPRKFWNVDTHGGMTPVSAIALSLCILVAFLTGLGDPRNELLPRLLFSQNLDWTEIKSGEVYRLITPVFLHFGLLHLLFNGMLLFDLAPRIERRRGSEWMLAFILVVAVGSNVGQADFSGPNFGGFSGVNYGFVGYAIILSRLAPQEGLLLSGQSAAVAIVWMLLGIIGSTTGNDFHMANWAHAIGFLMGCVIAWLDVRVRRRFLR